MPFGAGSEQQAALVSIQRNRRRFAQCNTQLQQGCVGGTPWSNILADTKEVGNSARRWLLLPRSFMSSAINADFPIPGAPLELEHPRAILTRSRTCLRCSLRLQEPRSTPDAVPQVPVPALSLHFPQAATAQAIDSHESGAKADPVRWKLCSGCRGEPHIDIIGAGSRDVRWAAQMRCGPLSCHWYT